MSSRFSIPEFTPPSASVTSLVSYTPSQASSYSAPPSHTSQTPSIASPTEIRSTVSPPPPYSPRNPIQQQPLLTTQMPSHHIQNNYNYLLTPAVMGLPPPTYLINGAYLPAVPVPQPQPVMLPAPAFQQYATPQIQFFQPPPPFVIQAPIQPRILYPVQVPMGPAPVVHPTAAPAPTVHRPRITHPTPRAASPAPSVATQYIPIPSMRDTPPASVSASNNSWNNNDSETESESESEDERRRRHGKKKVKGGKRLRFRV